MTLYVWEQPPTSVDWERHPSNSKTHPKGMPDEDATSLARCINYEQNNSKNGNTSYGGSVYKFVTNFDLQTKL